MEFTMAEEMEVERALLVAIERYEKDLVIFVGTPLADVSRLSLEDAKSALKKIKGRVM